MKPTFKKVYGPRDPARESIRHLNIACLPDGTLSEPISLGLAPLQVTLSRIPDPIHYRRSDLEQATVNVTRERLTAAARRIFAGRLAEELLNYLTENIRESVKDPKPGVCKRDLNFAKTTAELWEMDDEAWLFNLYAGRGRTSQFRRSENPRIRREFR